MTILRQSTNEMRRVRKRLHAADPRCHWCATPTILGAPWGDPNSATVDHIKPRRECRSQEEYKSAQNHVLACFECNQERDKVDIAMMAHQREQLARVEKLRVPTRRVLVRPSARR